MSNILQSLFILSASLLVCGGVFAAEPPPVEVPQMPEVSGPVKAELLALSDEILAIEKRGDWPALAKVLAPDYRGTAPGEAEWTLATYKAELPKIHPIEWHREGSSFKCLAPGVILQNEDGVLRETYADQDISGRYRFTTIWVRRGGRWRLLFEQEVPLTPAPETPTSAR